MSKNISSSKQKRLTGSSSSSFCGSSSSSIAELFEAPSSPPSNSSSIFRTVFGPPSMGRGRNSTTHLGNLKHASPENKATREKIARVEVTIKKKRSSNLAITALPSCMVVKKFTLPLPDPPNLTSLSGKMSKMMIPTVLQEAIGGKVHCIINQGSSFYMS